MTMATDYDAPRRTTDEGADPTVRALTNEYAPSGTAALGDDVDGLDENLELPGADLSGETLTMRAVPQQGDEFTCSQCFLVQHRRRLATHRNGQPVCRECA
jgi:hypothetical protein